MTGKVPKVAAGLLIDNPSVAVEPNEPGQARPSASDRVEWLVDERGESERRSSGRGVLRSEATLAVEGRRCVSRSM